MPSEELEREILRAIRQIVRRIAIHSRQLQREVGLSTPQVVCLQAIGELRDGGGGGGGGDGDGEVTIGAVSARVELSPPTVSRIVDRLIEAGLVSRARSDTDRRRVDLALTRAGRRKLDALPTPLQELFLTRLGALPDAERLALRDALHRVARLMSADTLDAAPLLTPGEDALP